MCDSLIRKQSFTIENVCKCRLASSDLMGERGVSRERNIQISRVRRDPAHGAAYSIDGAGDYTNAGSTGHLNFRDFTGENALIPRTSHLQLGGQVDPELKTINAFRSRLRHFLVHDSTTGSHPLNISRSNASGVSNAVAMIDLTP